jgi:beta-glucanase (GH16 family)
MSGHRHPHHHQPVKPPQPVPQPPQPVPPVPPPVPVPVVPPVTPVPPVPPATVYTFQDEFDGAAGSAPDPKLWGYDLGAQGGGSLENYTNAPANVYVNGDSCLVIAAQGDHTSAQVTTQGKFSQQYGHFEARITVHTPEGSSSTYQTEQTIASDSNWHVYRLDWQETAPQFTFSRDGTVYFTASESQFPDSSWVYGPATPDNGGMYVILNLGIGGYAGTPNPASWPVTLQVDYVHVWK